MDDSPAMLEETQIDPMRAKLAATQSTLKLSQNALSISAMMPGIERWFVTQGKDTFRWLLKIVDYAQNPPSGTHVSRHDGRTPTAIKVVTTTTVYGTIEEVAGIFMSDNAATVLEFAETSRLYRLQGPSETAPFRSMSICWSKWKSPSRLVRDRDLVYVEAMNTFVDRAGRRGWARSTKSVSHPQCPPFLGHGAPVRANMYSSGMILRETRVPGELQCTMLMHLDFMKIPAWMSSAILKSRANNIDLLNKVLRLQRRQRADSMMGSRRMRSTTLRGKETHCCKNCQDRLSRWKRKHRCQLCGVMLCKVCASLTYVDAEGKEQVKCVCADCGDAFRKPTDTQQSGTEDSSSLDDVTRFSSRIDRFQSDSRLAMENDIEHAQTMRPRWTGAKSAVRAMPRTASDFMGSEREESFFSRTVRPRWNAAKSAMHAMSQTARGGSHIFKANDSPLAASSIQSHWRTRAEPSVAASRPKAVTDPEAVAKPETPLTSFQRRWMAQEDPLAASATNEDASEDMPTRRSAQPRTTAAKSAPQALSIATDELESPEEGVDEDEDNSPIPASFAPRWTQSNTSMHAWQRAATCPDANATRYGPVCDLSYLKAFV